MLKTTSLLSILLLTGCGYKVVGWSSGYDTLEIRPIAAPGKYQVMSVRMRDALIERCLAGSSLQPVDRDGSLVLSGSLREYRENVIATDIDGRTQRIQFNLTADFRLVDVGGREVWSLENYQYSDQYAITTTREIFRDEAVYVQDQALRSIANLVITNITLAIHETERQP